jgi:hypothetical protein
VSIRRNIMLQLVADIDVREQKEDVDGRIKSGHDEGVGFVLAESGSLICRGLASFWQNTGRGLGSFWQVCAGCRAGRDSRAKAKARIAALRRERTRPS